VGAEIIPVQLGDLVLGVRANDAALTTRLRALLAGHVVEGGKAPPNLSVALGRGPGDKHQLCRSGVFVLRTTSVGRLLRAVPLLLDGYAPPRRGVVRLSAWVLVGPDDAVLVDRRYTDSLERIEPRLARRGYQRWDGYFAEVEPGTGEVVLGPPRLTFADDAAATLEPPRDREVGPVKGWRRPVRSLLGVEEARGDGEEPTPARRLWRLTPLAAHHGRVDVPALRLLAAWLLEGRLRGGHRLDDAEVLAAVTGG
jgi:hypothetical protein